MQHVNLCPVKSVCKTAPSETNAASKSNPVVVTDIVSDGTNWCIKYSDGWIEQGGYVAVTSIAAYGTVEVTFNTTISGVDTSFISTPVYIHCTPCYTGTTSSAFSDYGVENASSTGFLYRKTGNTTTLSGFYWIAKGMGTTQEPEPSSDAYVEGDTLYAGSDVTNNTLNITGGSVDNNTLNL